MTHRHRRNKWFLKAGCFFFICFLISTSPDKIFVQPLLSIFLLAVTRLLLSFWPRWCIWLWPCSVTEKLLTDKQEAVTKKPHARPATHSKLQVTAPQMCPQKFKRQLNRCTKLQIRGDIKQLNLLKGTVCHHLTVTCILSPSEEGHALACAPGCRHARKIIKMPRCDMWPSCLRSYY